MVFFTYIIEDNIPSEKIIPEMIVIPVASYIHNKNHWAKYRNKTLKGINENNSKPEGKKNFIVLKKR